MSRALAARVTRQERAAGLTPWTPYTAQPFAAWPDQVRAEWMAAVVQGDPAAATVLSDADLDELIAQLTAELGQGAAA